VTCPDAEILMQLLNGASIEEAAIEAHLASCPTCQIALDRLSDNLNLRRWVLHALSLSGDKTTQTVVLRILAELDGPAEWVFPEGSPSGIRPPWEAGSVLGPYRIEKEIGRGGMGVVLRAYDEALGRVVALKMLPTEAADARARARLVHEAQAVARLRHPNVVTVHSVVNTADAAPFLVMEYLEGATLAARIRSHGRLPPQEAAELVAQAADGLEAAHAAGLIHRDIKPSNILGDAAGCAKLTDFGLAQLGERSSGLTQEGVLAGTPTYMSPEQARGGPLDARSDVYSLGVTLYEALTGETPFRGLPHLVLQKVLHDEPLAPRQLNDKFPRDLETIVLKALAKQPAKRYETAAALAEDLRRWRNGEPIRARPTGPLERGWRWCRRNRVSRC
jgi:serine/threonine-protein kinase